MKFILGISAQLARVFTCRQHKCHSQSPRKFNFVIKGQLILALFFVCSPSWAQERRKVDGPFEYELITSDIFPWIGGERGGPIGDEKRHMAQRLDELLTDAKKYVDFAVYGINRQDWLLEKIQYLDEGNRRVRAVVDQETGPVYDWEASNFIYPDTSLLPEYLAEDHIRVDEGPSGNARSSIMHNKFVVLDNQKVWLGSVNMSHTGIGSEYNANTVLVVDSPHIARIYVREFRQMYKEGLFSRQKVRANRTPLLFSDGTEVSIYFSPQDNVKEAAILPFIRQAKRTLNIGMFYLTDELVAEEIARAVKERRVKVRILSDALASHSVGVAKVQRWLRARGVDVRVENWGGKMHMKTAVADGKNIVIGSMNWSVAGHSKNDENTMIIKNNKKLGRALNRYFNKLWATLEDVGQPQRIFAESIYSINSCSDGLDNDYDGKVDSEDDRCK